MSIRKRKLKQLAGGLFLAAAMLMPSMWARAEDPAKQPEKSSAALALEFALQRGYWVGVHCRPVDKAMRAHLKLDHGLLVVHVAPESPAAKAGIQQHDILLEFGDAKLSKPRDLIKAVKMNKDQQAAVKLLRSGQEKTKTVQLVPGKRPVVGIDFLAGSGDRTEALVELIEEFRDRIPAKASTQLRWFGPGMVLSDHFKEPSFSKDLNVVITKEGDHPAKIVAKQGEKSWEVTDKELDKLPDDVRPHIERLLGRKAVQFHFESSKGMPGVNLTADRLQLWSKQPSLGRAGRKKSGPDLPRVERRDQRHGGFEKRLERKLEQVQRSLEKLQNELNQLHEDRSGKNDK